MFLFQSVLGHAAQFSKTPRHHAGSDLRPNKLPVRPTDLDMGSRDVAHVNSSGNYDTAFIEMTQCDRHECADRREDDGGIQFFGRRLVRSASPGSTETLRKFLGLGIAGAGEGENFTSFKNC